MRKEGAGYCKRVRETEGREEKNHEKNGVGEEAMRKKGVPSKFDLGSVLS